jgi:hypothetical protein
MNTPTPISAIPLRPIVVKLVVSHGDYRALFYGEGNTIAEAAENAAVQSSYSSELYNTTSRLYEERRLQRLQLVGDLESGRTFRDFGWCDFSRIA